MEPKAILMSEAGARYTLDDREGEKYDVAIEPSEYLVVSIGFTFDKAAARYTHPNIAASRKVVHNFKHYCRSGRKFWTTKAGVDHYLIIPKNKITMLPEKGYSYVPIEINGVKLKLNVTGGGGTGGWVDYVGPFVQTSVNHKLADLKKVAEVAVRGTSIEPIQFKEQDDGEMRQWENITSEKILRQKLVEMIEAGKKPKLKLKPNFSYVGKNEGVAESIQRAGKWTKANAEGIRHYNYTGAPKRVSMKFDDYHPCTAKMTQIDWIESGKLNGLK